MAKNEKAASPYGLTVRLEISHWLTASILLKGIVGGKELTSFKQKVLGRNVSSFFFFFLLNLKCFLKVVLFCEMNEWMWFSELLGMASPCLGSVCVLGVLAAGLCHLVYWRQNFLISPFSFIWGSVCGLALVQSCLTGSDSGKIRKYAADEKSLKPN